MREADGSDHGVRKTDRAAVPLPCCPELPRKPRDRTGKLHDTTDKLFRDHVVKSTGMAIRAGLVQKPFGPEGLLHDDRAAEIEIEQVLSAKPLDNVRIGCRPARLRDDIRIEDNHSKPSMGRPKSSFLSASISSII